MGESQVVEKVTKEVEDRLGEVSSEFEKEQQSFEERTAPLRTEKDELEALLGRIRGRANGRQTSRRGGGRRRGARKDEFLKLVQENPGITIADLAEKMGMKDHPNYLYRVGGELAKANKIRKDGRKLYVVAEGAEATS